MVVVINKSNRPIGIAGQSVLPDKEITIKDKDAYCAVFDEDGKDTGKKQIIPGLKALERRGHVVIREVDETPKAEAPKKRAPRKKKVEEVPVESEESPAE